MGFAGLGILRVVFKGLRLQEVQGAYGGFGVQGLGVQG